MWGSLGLIVAAHTSLGCGPLHLAGSHEQKQRFLVPMARGEVIGAYGLTEPGAGSDSGGTRTTARLRGRAGRRRPGSSTAASASSPTPARRARTSSPPGRARATTARPRSARSSCPPTRPASASAGSRTSWACTPRRPASSVFDGARVPAANLLGEQGSGFKTFLRILDGGRISIGALAVGIAQGALDASIPYAQTREQFGRPIGTFQGVAFMVADMATEIEAARALVWRAAWLKDQGRDFGLVAAQAKLFASEVSSRVDQQRDPDPRRLRLRHRVPGRALPARRQADRDRRGDQPGPAAGHRPQGPRPARRLRASDRRGSLRRLAPIAGAGRGLQRGPQRRLELRAPRALRGDHEG